MNMPGQKKIEEIVILIVQSYLEESLKTIAMNKNDFQSEDLDEDENENFAKEEKT